MLLKPHSVIKVFYKFDEQIILNVFLFSLGGNSLPCERRNSVDKQYLPFVMVYCFIF